MTEPARLEVVRGSGNVFRDLGLPNPDLEQLRAILAARIVRVLDEEELTVRRAAKLTGFAAADFSRVRRAKLGRFTVDRLGQEISFRHRPPPAREGRRRGLRRAGRLTGPEALCHHRTRFSALEIAGSGPFPFAPRLGTVADDSDEPTGKAPMEDRRDGQRGVMAALACGRGRGQPGGRGSHDVTEAGP